jgi:outer membrane protein assembly factor BamB
MRRAAGLASPVGSAVRSKHRGGRNASVMPFKGKEMRISTIVISIIVLCSFINAEEKPKTPISMGTFANNMNQLKYDVQGPQEYDLLWRYDIKSAATSSPVISLDGLLYFRASRYAICIDTTSIQKWKYNAESKINTMSIGLSGRLYITTWKGELHCLDMKGNLKWKSTLYPHSLKDLNMRAPQITPIQPNRIILSLGKLGPCRVSETFEPTYETIKCLANNGEEIWKFKPKIGFCSKSAIMNGSVVFTAEDKKLYCLSSVGEEIWSLDIDFKYHLPVPAIHGEYIYLSSDNGYIFKISNKGHLVKKIDIFSKYFSRKNYLLRNVSTPVVGKKGIYFATNGVMVAGRTRSRIICMDFDFKPKWNYAVNASICYEIVLDMNDNIYAGCIRELHAINKDGELIWARGLKDGVFTPVLDNLGNLFVGTGYLEGALIAIKSTN